MSHLTRLSIGDTDVDDENERDKEDDRDDVIDADEIHLPNDAENCCQRENIDLVMVQQVVECMVQSRRYRSLTRRVSRHIGFSVSAWNRTIRKIS
ncbi:hypothetical protein CK203_059095 [Vitis vinifera]|uniref:Uncharacterized protein n=1 Tax=Vitis vinifera TaxID=29760 RepID=A0A438GTX2_VITVI|nr:hypothetical protein CK203_059095 [Vitis vinifera]